MGFFLEVLIGGLLAGVLYSLVALGFVLIFKASGVFNFAQGAMVLTAALALVRALDIAQKQWHWPFGLALVAAFLFAAAVMAVIAWAAERLVLRKLVNQEGIILFMATIGITFFIEGLAQTVFGADVYPAQYRPAQGAGLHPRIAVRRRHPGRTSSTSGPPSSPACWSRAWRCSSSGRASAAPCAPLPTIMPRPSRSASRSTRSGSSSGWWRAWSRWSPGAVWGSKLGVQFSLSLLALKALPVLILGGFTSVPGAIIGGLIIGAGEKLAEVFLGPSMGGGIEIWFAYVVALLFLLVRPQGLFGERIIERV